MSEFEKSEKMQKEKIGEETVLVSPVGCRAEMMMNLRLWMVALFLLAAVGLLGGCAQSSGDADPDPDDTVTMDPDPDPDPDPVEPDGLSVAQGASFRCVRCGDDSLQCSHGSSRCSSNGRGKSCDHPNRFRYV